MTESTFIFLVITLVLFFIFGIAALICELYITYNERKNHLRVMDKVIKLEQLIVKGK